MAKPKRESATKATQESAAILAAFSGTEKPAAEAKGPMILVFESPAQVKVVLERRRRWYIYPRSAF
jgi:hypothetical protein